MQTYDVDKFVAQVKDLLTEAGLELQTLPGQPRPEVAAGMMLRSLGISPAADQVATLQRATDKIWSDEDELYGL